MFTIDKGVQIPAKKKKNGAAVDAVVVAMAVGDSVLTPYKPSGACSVFTLSARRRNLDFTFNARAEGEGCRVWRVA